MEGGEAGVVAVTKVFAIRVRLDDRVRYITDGEKTSLASSITYISNPEKTEQFFFTSALNCSSVDTALSEMMETKQQFGKMGGVLGYHFIQRSMEALAASKDVHPGISLASSSFMCPKKLSWGALSQQFPLRDMDRRSALFSTSWMNFRLV